MNLWRLIFAGVALLALSACAGQTGSSSRTKPAVGLANLPCAVINQTEAMTISYQVESLYRNGAVLPTEAGLACLEALANGLNGTIQVDWQVTVSGEDGYGFDALQLAEKRQELLQRFFIRKGLGTSSWQWQVSVAQGQQLEFIELTGTP